MELKNTENCKKVYCRHITRKSCLKVVRKLRKARRQFKIEMTKENEEDKLSYMTKKLTLINKRFRMHEKINTSEKAIKIAEMIKKKEINSECFLKLIKNMKPKKEEASAILNELGDVVEDTEEIKMVYSYHYKNLLMQKKQKHN